MESTRAKARNKAQVLKLHIHIVHFIILLLITLSLSVLPQLPYGHIDRLVSA